MTGKHISYAVQNIEGLSFDTTDISKIALVTEGGGQRGVFTAGVLDAFLEAEFNPFSLMVGTSAGSLNLASYICGQYKHAYKVITQATTDHHFFDVYRFIFGREGLDLDWLMKQTQTSFELDWHQGRENMRSRTVLASASGVTSHQASYFNLNSDNWSLALKASCAVPVLNKQPIFSQNEFWVDGGLCAPIPVQEAYERGYRHIVVVRTVPIDTSFDHCWMTNIRRALGNSKAAGMIEMLLEHEDNYRKTQEFLSNPPDDVTIFEIHPQKPLKSKMIGSDFASLDMDYRLGYQSGKYFLNTVGRHINIKDAPYKTDYKHDATNVDLMKYA
ncbi:patatin family protein [Photobacterium aquimaris]|uniref:Patatin family protein n=1 Tax=Photobacterium aquimaris TaxID=512643 RepID=A0A2T3HVG6_9GAMM|nr:patatin family protein [Photobacterium aquimaris]MCP4957160.1 patatin family protein [Photobacterium aquimaris]OBU14222.1 patatin family protein [Photobacterium aquimaris]PQJ38016.1 patatin family protein [Photobacterium aquimaris]PSU02542.1 patatin family protein [Photobacterium aquimaris]